MRCRESRAVLDCQASRLERFVITPRLEKHLGHLHVPAGNRGLATDLRRRRIRQCGELRLGDLLEQESDTPFDELAEVELRERLERDELLALVGEGDRR